MSEEPKFALIGCGAIGARRLEAMAETGLGRCVSVYDTDGDRAKQMAESFQTAVAGSVAEIFENETVEGVLLATPNQFLAQYLEQALEHGKHALVEKPGVCSGEQLRKLISLLDQRALVVKVGYNHRFHPAAQKIKSLLSTSERIVWIRAAYGHGGRQGYESEWRFQPELSGGGEIIDQGVHLLDLIHWWCNDEFELAHAVRSNAFYRAPVEDNGFLFLRSKKKATLAQLHVSVTQWKNLFRVELATERRLFIWEGLGKPSYGAEKLIVHERPSEGGVPESSEWSFAADSDISWELEWRHFVECVKAGADPASSLWDSVSLFEVLDKVHDLEVERQV